MITYLGRPDPAGDAPGDDAGPAGAEGDGRLAALTAELETLRAEQLRRAHALAHDLRGPLMQIGGYSDLLREQAAAQLDDTGRLYLEKITAATEAMRRVLAAFAPAGRAGAVLPATGRSPVSSPPAA